MAAGTKALRAGSSVMVAPSIVVLAGVGVADATALLVAVGVELGELLPQPAATSIATATANTATPANTVRLPVFDASR
jgi:CBS domain containing-hemolysin-like protein